MQRSGIPVRLLSLIAVTAIWGGTFVTVKDAVSAYPVAGFFAYRFLLATLLFLPMVRRIEWPGVRAGIPIGLLMGGAFIVQTMGLRLTLASDTGLITGLSVVFVPLIEWLLWRMGVSRPTLAGLLVALLGLVLLVGGMPRQLAIGELLVGISALGFAGQIIMLSARAPQHPTGSLTLGLMIGAAAVFIVVALTPPGGGMALPPASIWPAVAFTAIFATAIGFLVQAWAQEKLPATPAAVVLLTEPAWAVLFGVLLQGNAFSPARIIGAGLLFVAPIAVTLAGMRRGRNLYVQSSEAKQRVIA
jgi:drug/metabolite transporter (DMT)-like permease